MILKYIYYFKTINMSQNIVSEPLCLSCASILPIDKRTFSYLCWHCQKFICRDVRWRVLDLLAIIAFFPTSCPIMQFICVKDYEEEAHRKLPKQALDYYRSGADEEITLRSNVDAFKKWKILPRFLRDVSKISIELEVFGDKISCPIGASPTAMHKVRLKASLF